MATPIEVANQLFMMNQAMQYVLGFFMVLIVLFALKTPAITFLKGFLTGKPIIALKRKDGKWSFSTAKYSEGILWHKGGFHQIDPDAVAREKRSGCDFHLALDSIGITLSDKVLMFLKTMKDKFKFKNVDEIIDGINAWRKCNKEGCKFVGIPEITFKETPKLDKDDNPMTGKDGKILIERIYNYKCPKCGENKFTKVDPEIKFPVHQVFDPGFIDNYFLYNMNPSANEVITMREVQNQLDSEKKKQPILWVSIGVMILLILMGFMILYTVISKDTSGLQNVATNIGNLQPPAGLTG